MLTCRAPGVRPTAGQLWGRRVQAVTVSLEVFSSQASADSIESLVSVRVRRQGAHGLAVAGLGARQDRGRQLGLIELGDRALDFVQASLGVGEVAAHDPLEE